MKTLTTNFLVINLTNRTPHFTIWCPNTANRVMITNLGLDVIIQNYFVKLVNMTHVIISAECYVKAVIYIINNSLARVTLCTVFTSF